MAKEVSIHGHLITLYRSQWKSLNMGAAQVVQTA
jgi:hypothetical protein